MKLTFIIQIVNMISAANLIVSDDLYLFEAFMDSIIDPFLQFHVEEKSHRNDKKHREKYHPDMSILSRISKQASGFHEEPRSSTSYLLV